MCFWLLCDLHVFVVIILRVFIFVVRHKSAASWYARATFWGWVFWFGYWERNYGKLIDFAFVYDGILAWCLKLMIVVPVRWLFEVYGIHVILGFEGCIVRGQWWPMESKAWNFIQGHGHFERCSQGFESWWHIYFSNFWPGFKKELFGVSPLIGVAVIESNIFKFSWQPHFRRPIFNAPDFTWSVEWTTFGETFHYFVYVLKKVGPITLFFLCW